MLLGFAHNFRSRFVLLDLLIHRSIPQRKEIRITMETAEICRHYGGIHDSTTPTCKTPKSYLPRWSDKVWRHFRLESVNFVNLQISSPESVAVPSRLFAPNISNLHQFPHRHDQPRHWRHHPEMLPQGVSTIAPIISGSPSPGAPVRRRQRRRAPDGSSSRSCPHCGRTFKRTEHLERHVRTR